jgi:ferrous iron transport protein A
MKLINAPINETLYILNYTGGKGVASKLRQLGLCPGRKTKVLRYAPMGGPVMVEVGGRSVAIGRGIAARIEVEKI